MDKEKLIDFLERSIQNLKNQKELLEQRYYLLGSAKDEEFMLNKPISPYQERKEYIQNIKDMKLNELNWEILSVEDKIYGYETQIEITKNAKEENNK